MKEKLSGLLVIAAAATLLAFVWSAMARGQCGPSDPGRSLFGVGLPLTPPSIVGVGNRIQVWQRDARGNVWMDYGQSFASDEKCPNGGCPAPGTQQSPLDVGGWRASPQSSQRVHGTAPEYVVKLNGGTGTLIYKDTGKGVILTAYHVVKGKPRTGFTVDFPTGEVLKAHAIDATDSQEIIRDLSADLTLLVTETSPRARPCPIAMEPPKPGESVTIGGYGSDRRYASTAGVVREYSADGDTLIMSGEA